MTTQRIILKVSIPEQHDVTLYVDRTGRYKVSYGQQVTGFGTMMQAIAEYESCVVHALTCNGEMD